MYNTYCTCGKCQKMGRGHGEAKRDRLPEPILMSPEKDTDLIRNAYNTYYTTLYARYIIERNSQRQ